MVRIQIPSSKSDGQRALLAAALCEEKSLIYNLGNSDDERNMLEVIQQLGAIVTFKASSNCYEIMPSKSFPSKATLNVGESGLAFRLITSVCAAVGGEFLIEGKGTLNNRSMQFFQDYFNSETLKVELSDGGKPPVRLFGKLSGEFEVDGSESSQYISGMLMAIPLLKKERVLIVNNLVSKPYVEMTISTLTSFGVAIDTINKSYYFDKALGYKATNYTVEGDWSSASYWLVASAIGAKVAVKGLSLISKQADRLILEAFKNANCYVNVDSDSIIIDGTNKTSFSFDANECPDLFPALVVLAAFCDGISEINGVLRLKNKESNRGKVLQAECAKIGVQIEIENDIMRIHGGENINGGVIHSNFDHRIAMAFGILQLFTLEKISIEHPEVVSKSYPQFWEHLSLLKNNQ